MRSAFFLVPLLGLGCGVRLDETNETPKPHASAPVVAACRWFPEADARIAGRVSSVSLGDGNRLFIAGNVGGMENVGFLAPESATPDDCFASATRIDHALLPAGEQALSPV